MSRPLSRLPLLPGTSRSLIVAPKWVNLTPFLPFFPVPLPGRRSFLLFFDQRRQPVCPFSWRGQLSSITGVTTTTTGTSPATFADTVRFGDFLLEPLRRLIFLDRNLDRADNPRQTFTGPQFLVDFLFLLFLRLAFGKKLFGLKGRRFGSLFRRGIPSIFNPARRFSGSSAPETWLFRISPAGLLPRLRVQRSARPASRDRPPPVISPGLSEATVLPVSFLRRRSAASGIGRSSSPCSACSTARRQPLQEWFSADGGSRWFFSEEEPGPLSAEMGFSTSSTVACRRTVSADRVSDVFINSGTRPFDRKTLCHAACPPRPYCSSQPLWPAHKSSPCSFVAPVYPSLPASFTQKSAVRSGAALSQELL